MRLLTKIPFAIAIIGLLALALFGFFFMMHTGAMPSDCGNLLDLSCPMSISQHLSDWQNTRFTIPVVYTFAIIALAMLILLYRNMAEFGPPMLRQRFYVRNLSPDIAVTHQAIFLNWFSLFELSPARIHRAA